MTDIPSLYFDESGAEITHAEWREAYPARVQIARTRVWGALVCTEFVGINHRPDTRHTPWIYETTTTVQGVTYSFAWSGGLRRSRWRHAVACVVLWWRLLW